MLDTSQTDQNTFGSKNVEVIYNHVILVLKGVSLKVPKVALLRFWVETVQESLQHLSQFLICCFQSQVRLPKALYGIVVPPLQVCLQLIWCVEALFKSWKGVIVSDT